MGSHSETAVLGPGLAKAAVRPEPARVAAVVHRCVRNARSCTLVHCSTGARSRVRMVRGVSKNARTAQWLSVHCRAGLARPFCGCCVTSQPHVRSQSQLSDGSG